MMLSVNRLALIALTAGLLVLGPSGVAAAETTVSGERDTNAPLVIDPSSDPTDPLTTSLSYMPGLPQLIRIQRMPVTKTIQQVTIGDLSRGDTCTSNPKLQLYVHEFASGNFMQGNQLSYSTVHPEVGPQPSKITWTLPPTTLRAGRAYSFRVQYRDEPPGCTDLNQTTWAHNEPQVEGGPVACNGSLQFAADSSGYGPRFWHVHGQADEPAGTLCDTSDFDPVLPTGWLVVRPDGNLQRGSRTPEYDADPQYNVCRDTSPINPVEHGALETYSNSVPNTQLHTWVCRWPQFAAPGDETSDGWYYAVPWRQQRDGEPRDMYLKLDTIDYDELLQRHLPYWLYDSGESFHIVSPRALTDYWDPLDFLSGNWLEDADHQHLAIANPELAADIDTYDLLTLSYLGETYPAGGDSSRAGTSSLDSDLLQADANEDNCTETEIEDCHDYQSSVMESKPGYAYKVYGHVAYGSEGKLWLQYWIFFYYNPDPFSPFGDAHEGDWEMIQVGLNGGLTPDTAVYSQHNTAQRCPWQDVERTGDIPVVYVAEHSHASYFGPDRIPFPYDVYDSADGEGGGLFAGDLEEITGESPGWVAWRGRWGESGPPGPRFQPGAKWTDPSGWAASAEPC